MQVLPTFVKHKSYKSSYFVSLFLVLATTTRHLVWSVFIGDEMYVPEET